ncbi:MAG TPA: M28 family peptidase [Terriglobales bacterium]|jgi:Zn-dependent M28 family amino/carboxypeptidase
MRKSPYLVLSLVLFALSAAQGAPKSAGRNAAVSMRLPSVAIAALQKIDPEHIRAHDRFLSLDLLEGRGTGQRGGDLAAEYIATQLWLYGLKPAGENGTFFQKVPLIGITPAQGTTFTLAPRRGDPIQLRPLDDYVAYDETDRASDDIDADIVYVGYGIEAPEYQWDDYKGVDVRGKVLLMLVNEPTSGDANFFKGPALTYYGRWTYKYEEAARKGAVGAILIHKTDMASYPWEVVRNSNSGEKEFLKSDAPQLKAASWIQLNVAGQLAQRSGMDLDKMMADAQSRNFHPVQLPVRLKAHMVSKIRQISSNNVVAMLPGSDPKLKDEAVMYTAHYDHLGIRPDMPGDNIYNGAEDNATGCGILLEMARVFSQAQARPKRSLIFAAVTAEEQGLLGSEYLGKHPPIPAGKITLDLNFDDIPPLGEPEEVEVSGAERTTFYPTVEALSKTFRLAIRPDAHPEAGYYYRSDHFSMARVGIPAFSVTEGLKYKGHTRDWGMQQAADYTNNHYHQPSDEYSASMDFRGDATIARFGFALGWAAASQPNLSGWQKGDEFEKPRLESQGAGH